MYVKTHNVVSGIPNAIVTVSFGITEMGSPVVLMRIAALDALRIPMTVTTLRLSPTEAKDVASRILFEATKQDGS